MGVTAVTTGQRQTDLLDTGALVQASTSAYVTVAGGDIDARGWRTVSYTILVATHDVTWKVLAANNSDYSDAVIVQAGASVVAGAAGSFTDATSAYAFYRAQIEDTVGGTHGSATVHGIAKP